jgi:hypothetical protein
MKNSKILAIALVSIFTFSSCSDDDDKPAPVVENEVITTITAVYTPVGGGATITLEYKDLDGIDGPNNLAPTSAGKFTKGKTYNGVVTFLNETGKAPVDITEEIKELALDHQIFYKTTGASNSIFYDGSEDKDLKGNPIGLKSVFKPNENGTLTITLIHEPNKSGDGVADGVITNAGGSTDAEVTFNIVVE